LFILLALAVFNVVLNFIFIPKYGFVAAAWTTLVSEALGFVLLLRMILKGGFTLSLKRTLFSLFRAIIAAVAVFWLASTFWPYELATIISLIAYALIMFLVEFDQGDKELIREATSGIGKYVSALYNIVREKSGL